MGGRPRRGGIVSLQRLRDFFKRVKFLHTAQSNSQTCKKLAVFKKLMKILRNQTVKKYLAYK
jgi:hypothetical protein